MLCRMKNGPGSKAVTISWPEGRLLRLGDSTLLFDQSAPDIANVSLGTHTDERLASNAHAAGAEGQRHRLLSGTSTQHKRARILTCV